MCSSRCERVQLRAAQDHFTRARRLEATGKLDEALVEYQIAAEARTRAAATSTTRLSQHPHAAAQQGRVIGREGKTQLETLIDESQNAAPPGLDLPADVRLPASLVFRDASARDIYTVHRPLRERQHRLRPDVPR